MKLNYSFGASVNVLAPDVPFFALYVVGLGLEPKAINYILSCLMVNL